MMIMAKRKKKKKENSSTRPVAFSLLIMLSSIAEFDEPPGLGRSIAANTFHPQPPSSSKLQSNPAQRIMESEATATYPVGGDEDDPLLLFNNSSPLLDIQSMFAQISDDWNMEDLLWLHDFAAPPDLQFAGDTSHSTIAGLRQPVQLENLPEQNAHLWLDDWPDTSTGLIQPATYSIGMGNAGRFTSGMGVGVVEENPHSWGPLLGFNAAGHAMPEPDPYSSGDSSCPSTTDHMGTSSSPDLEINTGTHFLPSGGGGDALTEASLWTGPFLRNCIYARGTSSSPDLKLPSGDGGDVLTEVSTPDFGIRPRESHIKPPAGSTDHEIIFFLRQAEISMARGDVVNLDLGDLDQFGPRAIRSYVTTVEMMPDQKTCLGYWKEKQVKPLGSEYDSVTGLWEGLKRTFQFHKYDGTKTNWFMHEYIPTDVWSADLYMKGLRFREVYEEVYEGAEVPVQDEPTSSPDPEVKIKNKNAASKKHRMRGPENLVIKGESPAWQHFIKIYDRHPELEGSKVVYAVCCHCEVVLKAGTENGTKSLLTHCDRTCPVRNKKQQPSSSSPYSTGDTSCLPTSEDTGNSSLDQDFNAGTDLPQSGGGSCALPATPVRASCKKRKLTCGSSSQRSTLPEFNLELLAGLVQSDPSTTDIKPRTGSTDIEIIRFLKSEESLMSCRKEVNLSLGEQDQMAPKAVQSYLTTVKMMADQNPHNLGYWKEKQVKLLHDYESDGKIWSSLCRGIKRTFQFHMNDGTKTNWFMHEYVPTDHWGRDLFMKPLRFREVYEGAEVPGGEPTFPEVKIKKKIAAAKKHRMRGPENMVIKGESPAWQHFIKIYDRHPELEGSKVVYAVCCNCEGVLKAGTENGTSSLLTHCNRNCPVKNKKQQPSSSSYQEELFGVP